MISTTAYSYAATCYPKDVEKIVSTIEVFLSIGLIIGPVVGSFLYSLMGFSMTFYIMGALMIPIALLSPCLIQKAPSHHPLH